MLTACVLSCCSDEKHVHQLKASSEQHCDSCGARKSGSPSGSDLSALPSWLATCCSPNFQRALDEVLGRHPEMFFADLTHTLLQGNARDHVGTLLVKIGRALCKDGDLDACLQVVCSCVFCFCCFGGCSRSTLNFRVVKFQSR